MRKVRFAKALVACWVAACLALGACGGGGGGGGGGASLPPPPPAPPTSTNPTWTPGVYAAASTFEDRCQVVRTGFDIEGNAFPDRPGSMLIENFWLRSWTNETYLWNTEVTDRNPASFANRLDYFGQLRTTAITPSGTPKDDFHFSQPTADFLAQRNSAPTASYGAAFAVLSATPPRDVRVLYTDPNTPAAQINGGQANFIRGTRILNIDGVDVVNGGATQAEIDTLNNGLFPANAGESHTFVVQDPGASSTRTVTISAAALSQKPVNRVATIDTPSGRVGYALINTFSPFASERDIAEAITQLNGQAVTDLVLDLRYNGGGLLAVASQLGYMVAGSSRTSGRDFERLQFNAAAGALNPVTRQPNAPTPFFSTGLGFTLTNGTPLDTLNLARVYVLATESTCSASEAVVNGLRGVGVDVVLVGSGTCGKPYGFYPTDNCGETYYTIQFRGVNDVGFGDYADGFIPANSSASFGVRVPGCAVPDDLTHELGDENEAMLATALAYRSTGSCPIATTRAPPAVAGLGGGRAIASSSLSPAEEFLHNSRDMRLPN